MVGRHFFFVATIAETILKSGNDKISISGLDSFAPGKNLTGHVVKPNGTANFDTTYMLLFNAIFCRRKIRYPTLPYFQ